MTEEKYRAVIESAQDLVDWLNGNGLTNKSRRGRVPAKLLEALESKLAESEGESQKEIRRSELMRILNKHSNSFNNQVFLKGTVFDSVVSEILNYYK